MSQRILFLENRCKLTFSDGYLLAEGQEGSVRVFLEDLEAVVFGGLEVSVSLYLLDKLVSGGKTVVFCDGKRIPYSGLLPLYGVKNSFARIKEQLQWDQTVAAKIWRQIVLNKIQCQQEVLALNRKRSGFSEEILPDDASNAEGRFADFYFHELFGRKFHRHFEDNVNAALNYGYAVLTSAMARIVAGHGFLPAIGIHHRGETNTINLACDCVEPFRPIVDEIVLSKGDVPLDRAYKTALIGAINREVLYLGTCCSVRYAMERFFCDITESLQTKDIRIGEIKLY